MKQTKGNTIKQKIKRIESKQKRKKTYNSVLKTYQGRRMKFVLFFSNFKPTSKQTNLQK
jgi:hypothetical protein